MKNRKPLCKMVALTLALVMSLIPIASVGSTVNPGNNPVRPIIFVHGSAGSAQQFESQAMRFTSNGFPAELLFAFEYDSGIPDTEGSPARMARLDAFVDAVLASTGADKVNFIGHSRGTMELRTYVGVPERAAKVAKIVQIDGTALATPFGIPTMAIWSGMRIIPPTMPEAINVRIPNQPHIEVATSAEAFYEMYEFFTGNPPATTDIVLDPCDQIELAGKAVFFPQNRGVGDATVEIWEVDGDTGVRIGTAPVATYAITGTGWYDGNWGPFEARGGTYYEFVLLRPGFRPHHFYTEPFIRSNRFVRLLTSPPGGIGDQMERDDGSMAIVISRQKEWWGDRGADNDVLTIDGVHVVNPVITPHSKTPTTAPHMGIVGIFVNDRFLNGATDLSAPIPFFYAATFMTGADIFIPAAEPPNRTVSLALTPRGGGGGRQVLNIRNWASLGRSVTVLFNDFYQPDTTPPAVTITTPADGAEYLLHSVIKAHWTARDDRCIIAFAEGTVPSGTPIDTGTVGTKSFTVTAGDKTGNSTEKTVTYHVRYAFSGVLRPINDDGSSVFRLGRTVPVKFRLWDANGAPIANAVARIFLRNMGDNLTGTEIGAVSTDAATTGNLFRYCPTGNQYIFNWNTRDLSSGNWQIRIELDDGTNHLVRVNLR